MTMHERRDRFQTLSGLEVSRLYTADDLKNWSAEEKLGVPGTFPYTRGVYPTMYRRKLWTMRQFAGFGSAEDTNRRFKYLLEQGQTGLSVAFDMPTLMGIDADDPRAHGEIGHCGVSVSSLDDMERLFADIPLDTVTTSMTINGPAAVIFAMYLAVAQRRGMPLEQLGGTLQNDILKEYIAQKEWLFPPEPSLRLVTDVAAYCTAHVPKWHPISISGYHIREAGATAVQELAFTLYNGLTYVETAAKAGLSVDRFASTLSFFFNVHNDFFEEVAKFRAARRLWAREVTRRYNPADPRSAQLRCHAQTAGCSLTAQQPMNNVVRTTLQALAAVLGGTQSLHTNSMDETLALPTEEAAKLALRTQQIIAHETGVASTVDPLGGSYFVEALTDRLEAAALGYFRRLDQMGGMVKAIEQGYPQREILDASQRYQREIEDGDRIIVGVNRHVDNATDPIPTLKIGAEVEQEQVARLSDLRKARDSFRMAGAVEELQEAASCGENVMPYLIEAVKARATVGEICSALQEIYGAYREPVVL